MSAATATTGATAGLPRLRIGEGWDVHQLVTGRPLILGGVTHRFPQLRFAFLEGGVGWACNLVTDLVGHWDGLLIALVAFGVLTFTRVNPVWVILVAATFGFFVYR